ncbi:MAG: Rrf2 family transcriptional regulator [Sphaerochaetaceae bacterium]|nr:Rrf2 family transcriptional regulator [Sphaerochaetaceae bacterium]MDC7237319.1 Rrf2 family transcriptional regulator [Sphaerochaetaceae bacterium]MDC7242499.1 Rrf2 family transcriptional regulator [Sphaerochaetaceae bacterium]MDC7250397.1 Rrf2 family transcriptional regulator [Sphaerochaetaceae bacterium]
MMISTKGRYALRVMVDLAKHMDDENYISLKAISQRQEISLKYLEAIIGILNRAGFVQSLRGVNGGYRLTRDSSQYSVGEILRLTEGGLTLVNCTSCNNDSMCSRADNCYTLPVWANLETIINNYLDKVSLYDILNRDYKIDLEK